MVYCASSGAVTVSVLVVLVISTSESIPKSTLQWHRHRPPLTQQQSEEGYCLLPPPLENGRFSPSRNRCPTYMSSPACQMIPGTPVPPNWVIFNACNLGYKLQNGKTISVCFNGRWTPELPTCTVDESCKLPKQPTYGRYETTSLCRSYVEGVNACRDIPGTVVPTSWKLKYICIQGYRLNSTSMYSVCENGLWTNPIDCIQNDVVQGPGTGQTTDQANKGFTCPVPDLMPFGDHSRHPYPGNCHFYIICLRDGTMRVGNCYLGQAFNKTIGMCADTHTVQC